MPELGVILQAAQAQAAAILGRESETLRLGLWFNEMKPGHKTLPHTHDDADELLSGVYYVTAPPRCGNLVLTDGDASVALKPQAGMFVFFPPDLLHEVEPNRSDETRLSLGMNFGALDRTDLP